MWPNPQKSADLVTFTKENFHKKLHLLCSEGVLFTPLEAEVILVHIFPHSDWIRRDTRTEYREIPRISLYSVRMWENTGQNNSEYGHISRSDYNANRNNMQQNSFIKVYWIRYGFEVARDSPYLKSRNISCYQTINWKPDSCFWFVRKVKKMIKTNL